MKSNPNIQLNASEVAGLWSTYQNDSMGLCMLDYFLTTVEEESISHLLKETRDHTDSQLGKIRELLDQDGYLIPIGFSKEDVNLNAPKLFTDTFVLIFLSYFGRLGLTAYGYTLSSSSREDVREFFTECITTNLNLYNRVSGLMLKKGILPRPSILYPESQIHFMKNEGLMQNLMGNSRPLLAIEISNLFNNVVSNGVGRAIMTGFRQVSSNKKIQDFMLRGSEIATKHVDIFSSLLQQDELQTSITWDIEVTPSKIAPFSDKLMLFLTTALTAAGIANYALGIASSFRIDLATTYLRLSAEIGEYANDGTNLLIEHQWLEQMPSAVNREALVKT